jgi:methyl-accepting chemotaxis protein
MNNAIKKVELGEGTDFVAAEMNEMKAKLDALNRVQAVIEFNLDGTIITANDNFLGALGYSLEEIEGKHHRMFCEASYTSNIAYKRFWEKLGRGEFEAGEYKRITKDGREIWINASYNPVMDANGKPYKIVKFATDITAQKNKNAEFEAKLAAVSKVQAVIEFNLDGTIITANDNFLGCVGYSLQEIQGKHHRMFADPVYASSPEYKALWEKLNRGESDAGEYKRFGKGGKEIWINASYNPVFDANGKPYKVVKFATDVTAQKNKNAEFEAKLAAVSKSQAVIEFNLDGTIITANDNFLKTLGYDLSEIQGKHHRMFASPEYANSSEYRAFWEKLNRGEFDAGEYKRVTKTGKEIWISASYNPIFNASGKVYKVVKFASDITQAKLAALESAAKMAAVSKAQAVIEFNLDGTIITANDNFLKTLGYDLSEIKGKHHRMFAEPAYAASNEYRAFWEKLNRGEYDSGEYKRVGRGGKEVWINASYNPIMDPSGKPYKVVKFATDITAVKHMISAISETASALSGAAAELTATATEMENTSNRTSDEAVKASSASEQVAAGVQTVATNMEEMVASIKEIARSTNDSSQMAKTTMARAKDTNSTIIQLGNSSQEIGDVIKVISSIAQQTNLLALNATIEAARAGEAGRGFAVVANEVKELAKQTAKATNDITNKIGAIQKDTQKAVEAIGGISEAVEKLNGISGVIAAAVEEQTATTDEVSRVVAESKQGVESIATTVKNVSGAASESKTASGQTLTASRELSKLAERLHGLVKGV